MMGNHTFFSFFFGIRLLMEMLLQIGKKGEFKENVNDLFYNTLKVSFFLHLISFQCSFIRASNFHTLNHIVLLTVGFSAFFFCRSVPFSLFSKGNISNGHIILQIYTYHRHLFHRVYVIWYPLYTPFIFDLMSDNFLTFLTQYVIDTSTCCLKRC